MTMTENNAPDLLTPQSKVIPILHLLHHSFVRSFDLHMHMIARFAHAILPP
jgi:hypothetical protein